MLRVLIGIGICASLALLLLSCGGRQFDSIKVNGSTLWAWDRFRLTPFARMTPRGYDSVSFVQDSVWLKFIAAADGGGRYRYRMHWSRPPYVQSGGPVWSKWSDDWWEFVPRDEWEEAISARGSRGDSLRSCREAGRMRLFPRVL